MRSAEELTAIAIGLLLLALAGYRKLVGKSFGLQGTVMVAWGVPFLFGGLHFVWYSDLNWQGIIWGSFFCSLILLGINLANWWNPKPQKRATNLSAPVKGISTALAVGRVLALLTMVGVLGRLVHTFFILRLPLFTDFAAIRSEEYTGEVAGSIWSRIGFLLFLWPIPLSIAIALWNKIEVSDRLLLSIPGIAFPAYGILFAGRSPILTTTLFLAALLAVAVEQSDWKRWIERNRAQIRNVSLAVALFVALTMVFLYGLRAYSDQAGRNYSDVYEISSEMYTLKSFIGDGRLTEGLIGTIGYVGQPVQRLSEYFDLDIPDVYYGGWIFEFADTVLRRLGVLDGPTPRMRLMAIYEPINLRYNTFSTLGRDTVLDFGMIGAALFAVTIGFVTEHFRLAIHNNHRWELAPLYGLLFATIALSGLANFLPEHSFYISIAFAIVFKGKFKPKTGIISKSQVAGQDG